MLRILSYLAALLCCCLLLLSSSVWAFSNSELMEMEVSTVDRKLQKVSSRLYGLARLIVKDGQTQEGR